MSVRRLHHPSESGVNIRHNPDEPMIVILSDTPVHAQRIRHLLSGTEYGRHEVEIRPMKSGPDFLHHHFPSLIILDSENESTHELQVLKQIRASAPEICIMLITSNHDEIVAARALRAGVSAYIPSDELSTVIAQAIAKLAAGQRFVSEEVMQKILHGMTEAEQNQDELPIDKLSDREMTVFQLLSQGKNLRDIADEVGIHIKTVASHCNNIRRKLQFSNNHELILASIEWEQRQHAGQKNRDAHDH
jgi:DNA-binding NarL/FixJ family response regulator